ncbi:hypothetical protein J5N97_025353 [Dioscorea zingiberensis]|uniref:Cytochrome P450 n=1 Tax=Dioscorea zingiberensis TaxID=325984 RepID=A0A9D5C8D6_9LILI|nr:hypothetical protein J5N97_025353 [Dioscorea zingiberensis]
MGSMDAGWDLSLAIATKCGGADHHQLHLAGVVLFICTFMFFIHWASPGGSAWGKLRRRKDKPIPGPRGLPIIGSMNLMHGLAHRKLAAEAEAFKAWRLMAFSLGNTRVIITSDSDVAKEILNSSAFADRPVKESAYALMFHRAIGFAPYGVYWRTLRRIAATHFFSPKQLAASYPQRAEIADQMVAALKALSFSDVCVRARDVLKLASLNNIMWSVFGRRYELWSESDEEMQVLKRLVDEGYELLGKLNWSDHLTFLSGFDPQGIRFRCTRLVPKVNQFVTRLIDDHRAVAAAAAAAKQVPDFVDVLLSLPDADRLSDPDMVAVLWEMIFRGTDTVAVLIEWVLARLVMHGDVQEEVHKELDRVVGVHRAVTETDTGSLVYLNAVIKEVLRLHPPGPLLSWARLATCDTYVDGKHVPAGTTAMVNMWAITHDPHVWESPHEFRPNRFLEPNLEVPILGRISAKAVRLRRRICRGKALIATTVSFWVASLLHEFHWAPPSHNTRVDLSEVLTLSCEMAIPLVVKLYPRRNIT